MLLNLVMSVKAGSPMVQQTVALQRLEQAQQAMPLRKHTGSPARFPDWHLLLLSVNSLHCPRAKGPEV